MTPSQKLRSIADSTGLDGIADAIREIANEIEHNTAPAVPQGEPTEAMLTAGLRECEPLGELIDWREGFGRSEMRAVWSAMLAATPAPSNEPAQCVPDVLKKPYMHNHKMTETESAFADGWNACRKAVLSATPAPAPAQDEPFGYFRAEPFGWTDCAEDDEGAIALYERPQEVVLTNRQFDLICQAIAQADTVTIPDGRVFKGDQREVARALLQNIDITSLFGATK